MVNINKININWWLIIKKKINQNKIKGDNNKKVNNQMKIKDQNKKL
jgi:hypothetical protein